MAVDLDYFSNPNVTRWQAQFVVYHNHFVFPEVSLQFSDMCELHNGGVCFVSLNLIEFPCGPP